MQFQHNFLINFIYGLSLWCSCICIKENKNKWNKEDTGKAGRDFLKSSRKSHKENKKLLQEYHTQADENKAVETAILIMHLADCAPVLLFWKWMQCICSTREFSVGEYIKLKCFQKYLDLFLQSCMLAIFLNSCSFSQDQASHFAASYCCSSLPRLCWTLIFHPTFPLWLTSLAQLVIDFLLYFYNNQLFLTSDPFFFQSGK